MSFFSHPPNLSIVYQHPFNTNRPLFFIFDSVHILKCIHNNWLNQKNSGQCMYYIDFDDHTKTKTASFETVKKLHSLEDEKIVKYAYGVTIKALCPNNIERQNVKLVLQIFNEHVIQGLIHSGESLLHFKETADYIKLIYTWWSIMNVKTIFKGDIKEMYFNNP